MAHAAEPQHDKLRPGAPNPWGAVGRQVWHDLVVPAPGRLGLAWRVALQCAIAAGIAMMYHVPESAIGCYLIIYLTRPNAALCIGTALGIVVLASIVVLGMGSLITVTAESPLLRISVIALISFGFVYLGAASQLGEDGSIVALVIAFILTLVDEVPEGEIATRVLLYAWQMACMPMMVMIAFNMALGMAPHRLMTETVARRLDASADTLERDDPAPVREQLGEGNADAGVEAKLARLFHTAPGAAVTWLLGAAMNSYRLMLAVAALPSGVAADVRGTIARACRAGAENVRAGRRPEGIAADGPSGSAALDTVYGSLSGFMRDDGGSGATPKQPPFFAPDALTNPAYQLFALKTTAAAITCYLIYSLIDWQGIHTAMVTCYVAALGTTAETVHKLAQRICGCLVGAAIGFGSILFIIPHLESIGGLMILIFFVILLAAWVSSGSELVSYGGVQIGLAFLLTTLHGFSPSYSLDSGWDRVVGILLGNVVVYIYFTNFWPKGAVTDIRERFSRGLLALAQIAARPPETRLTALAEAETAGTEAAGARKQLLLLPFEPTNQRPDNERIAELETLADEMQALAPELMFASAAGDSAAERLRQAARRISGAPPSGINAAPPSGLDTRSEDDASAEGLDARILRIERLVAGGRT